MFDFARNAKLAIGDSIRRAAMKVVAGLVAAVGGGFLLAALWSFLANELGWGSALASLVIGVGFVLIAVLLIAVSSRKKHEMPTTDDLKHEVEARVSMAADAAVGRARQEADRIVHLAETKAVSVMDQATYRASKLANDTERKVFGSLRDTAQAVGLTSANARKVQRSANQARQQVKQSANSDTGSMAKLFAAFAVGITLAAKLQESRQDRDPDDFIN